MHSWANVLLIEFIAILLAVHFNDFIKSLFFFPFYMKSMTIYPIFSSFGKIVIKKL